MTTSEVLRQRLGIDASQIETLCRKWSIQELSLFGSVLRDDFHHSDVDLLVVFEPRERWDLWDIIAMERELQELFGRKVDLVEKRALKNPFRRYEILTKRQVVYAA